MNKSRYDEMEQAHETIEQQQRLIALHSEDLAALKAERDALQEIQARLSDALEVYGDPKNWMSIDGSPATVKTVFVGGVSDGYAVAENTLTKARPLVKVKP